jgi:hypothetical protein
MFSDVACVSSSITAAASISSAPMPAVGGAGVPTLNPGHSRFGREAIREPQRTLSFRDKGGTAVRAAQGPEANSTPPAWPRGRIRSTFGRDRKPKTKTQHHATAVLVVLKPTQIHCINHHHRHARMHPCTPCLDSAYLKPRLVRLPVAWAWSRNGTQRALEYGCGTSPWTGQHCDPSSSHPPAL